VIYQTILFSITLTDPNYNKRTTL